MSTHPAWIAEVTTKLDDQELEALGCPTRAQLEAWSASGGTMVHAIKLMLGRLDSIADMVEAGELIVADRGRS